MIDLLELLKIVKIVKFYSFRKYVKFYMQEDTSRQVDFEIKATNFEYFFKFFRKYALMKKSPEGIFINI